MTFPRWLVLLAACFTWRCAGTPQTDPPNFDPGLLGITRTKSPATIVVTGRPGAVKPPGSVLHVVNLDRPTPAARVVVATDGSFSVTVTVDSGDVLRFQVEDDGERSAAFDLRYGPEGLLLVEPSLACLTTSPASTLTFGSEARAAVQVRNDCSEAVSLSPSRLRVESTSFTILEGPTVLPPGTTSEVRLESSATGPDEHNVLLIDIVSPIADRRAVTLVGKRR